jgi:Xaa-Pro aminopeptidase
LKSHVARLFLAGLFNLRGSDIQYNPVFFAYAIVPAQSDPVLYISESKLSEEAKFHLKEANVTVRPYESIVEDVKSNGKQIFGSPSSVRF